MARGFTAQCTLACFTVGLALSRIVGAEAPHRVEAPRAAAATRGADGAYPARALCPSQSEWRAALLARLPDELHRHPLLDRVNVEVRQNAAGSASGLHVGVLRIEAASSSSEARRVEGEDCAEVVAALTLIAALDIERAAREGAASNSVASDDWHFTSNDAMALAEAHDMPPASVQAPPSSVEVGPGLFAMYGGALSGLAVGAGAVARWQNAPLEPWLLLGVYRATHGEALEPTGGGARFEQLAAHFAGCVWRLPRASSLALRPCLDVDIGRVTGEGVGIRGGRWRGAPWLSAGAELRLAWSPVHALTIDGMMGVVLPIVHPRFYVLPGVTALEVAPVGLRAGTGVSAAF